MASTSSQDRDLIGKIYTSTYKVAGGAPQVQFKVAGVKRAENGTVMCRPAMTWPGHDWYPVVFATVA